MAQQIPVVDYLVLGDRPHLVSRSCTACGALYFDRRNACARCFGIEFDAVDLANEGTLRTFTFVHRVKRPFVSAVYHNRLKRGMALQADPTVVYAHGRRLRRVWERQLQIKSPYNTYIHPGLPPGPINQPSDSSLIAALYPAASSSLYFVAQPDGKHVFSASYADHLAAIKRARQRPPPEHRAPGPPRSTPRR